MTDQTPGQTPGAPGAAPAGAAPAAATGEQPRITLLTQYVKDLSFENPNAPVIYAQLKGQPQIQVNVDVGANRLQERLAEVTLRLKLEAKAEEKTAFILELEYAGLCQLGGTPDQEETEKRYLVEAASMLFPFARAILANQTRDGGFAPLLLAPIDFGQLYQQKKARAAAGGDAGAAAAPSA